MGVSLARKRGVTFALISGEDNPLVARFAKKMNITSVYAGCKDKVTALQDFARQCGLPLSEIAFMGDDVNDLDAMKLAGLSAAPADAHDSVRQQAGFVSRHGGGHGAVREFLDHLAGLTRPSKEQRDA